MNSIQIQKEARPIYISSRIRLNAEQRQTLKDAYKAQVDAYSSQPQPVLAGSSVSVQTTFGAPIRDGLTDFVIRDLLTTRESISIGVVMKLQKILQVQILSEADLREAFDSYVKYVFKED